MEAGKAKREELKKKHKNRAISFWQDFKKFISKGNILDLAVGVVIGGAFGKIVTSLVNGIIMPFINLAVGRDTMAGLVTVLRPASEGVEAIVVDWGMFLQSLLDFVIIALFIFLAVRIVMGVRKKLEEIEQGLVKMNNKDRKALGKKLKAEGKTYAERMQAIAAWEEAETEKKKSRGRGEESGRGGKQAAYV